MMGRYLEAAGVYNLCIAVFHLMFWRLFRWREQLPRLSVVNGAIMQVLNLCLTLVFVFFAWLQLAHTDDIVGSPLARPLTIFMAVFWIVRSIEQPVFFPMRPLASRCALAVFVLGAVIHVLAASAACGVL